MSNWTSENIASAWIAATEARNRMMAPATERMFALAGIGRNATVLDVGTGTGDTALLLAARVGPQGKIVATDSSSQMAEAAAAAARSAGASQIEVRVIGAEKMELEGPPFDAAVARNVLMFVNDLPTALSRIRGVLRTGGRFAAITWAEIERNPYNASIFDAVKAHSRMPMQTPEIVRAFSLSDPDALCQMFKRAGFTHVQFERVSSRRVCQTVKEAMKPLHDMPLYREVLSAATTDELPTVLAAIQVAYARFATSTEVVFPSESLVVAGTA